MFSISKRPTIKEIHELYATSKAIPSQVVQFFLNRSKHTDKKIQAIHYYTEQQAALEAEVCDKLLAEFQATQASDWFEKLLTKYPLFGIPYATKSIILVKGEVFDAGSKIMDGYKAPYSATVSRKMNQAGAILMAICHMDEFATGSSGENSAYAVTRNPFDATRVPGGSSSGSAAAVASGQVVFTLGTDTGGSIRQPAAFCDVVGLKPTYGLVSRYGVMPMASSLDQVGPLSNSIYDNALVTKVLAGQDEMDQTTVGSQDLIAKLDDLLVDTNQRNLHRPQKKLIKSKRPLKIGLPKEFYVEGIDPQISRALVKLQAKLSDLGHQMVDISLPTVSQAISVYYMVMPVELAANLERIDGVRYAPQQQNYASMYFDHRGGYFGSEPLRRIMLGTYASSAGYYDAYYNRALKVREVARREFVKAFEQVDVLLTPTTPEFPFKVAQKTNDPLKMYLSDVFTCGINPVRIPGLTVPLGLFPVANEGEADLVEDVEGQSVDPTVPAEVGTVLLPTGCQILGPELSEDVLYQLGLEIETLVHETGEVR